MQRLILLLLVCVAGPAVRAAEPPPPLLSVPSPQQLRWQRAEMTMFLHFGVNTFTDREWGDGTEAPDVFRPSDLDCRQWVRQARAAGFGMLILTAKHHDGFCLWPSRYTDHCVRSSQWQNGRGDVVRQFVDACREQQMPAAFYLSPWDRHEPSYGDSPRYNQHFVNQLTELLTTYGPFAEVWFDGACGEGPNGKRQEYDWPSYYGTIRQLEPTALIAICGPDVRWVGNESGVARPGESSVRDAGAHQDGGASGKVWYPAECDVSIRPGWFYHASQDDQVKSVAHLLDIYFKSVGRNSVLLLNVPPDRAGQISQFDAQRLSEFRAALDEIFQTDLCAGRPVCGSSVRADDPRFAAANVTDGSLETYWATDDGVTTGSLEVGWDAAQPVNVINVQEYLPLGERVRRYHIEANTGGQWRTVAGGTIIGHRNLLRIPAVTAQGLRLVIDEAAACPAICGFGAYYSELAVPAGSGSLAAHQPAEASNVHGGGTVFGADKAVDDDPDTRWATADEVRECWLEVDLRQPQTIDRITIAELEPRVTQFQIEYRLSQDDAWKTALSGNQAGRQFEAKFPPVQARYVRLHILAASFAPTIWEFGVFGPAKPEQKP